MVALTLVWLSPHALPCRVLSIGGACFVKVIMLTIFRFVRSTEGVSGDVPKDGIGCGARERGS